MHPRRTQQERRDTTRRALLAAAAALVVESGSRAVTLAEVGRRAGYSRGIVSHHFGSRHALVEALVIASRTGFVIGLDAHEPGPSRLFALLQGYLAAVDGADRSTRAFLVLWAESIASPELGPLFREQDAAFRAQVVADVRAGLTSGEVRGNTSSEIVAAVVVAELRGLALQHLVAPQAVDPDAVGRALVEHWREILCP